MSVTVESIGQIVVVDQSRQGPVGDVNPEMYVLRDQANAASISATSSASSASGSATNAQANAVTASAQASIATAQAIAASSSATASADSQTAAQTQTVIAQAASTSAQNAVASVTVGSTNSLAYPEQIQNLITAADVVDVLIYDTRLDSDGGAWTERCTGTSWYQETLNTATRGVKRAFPKVALIVVRGGTSGTSGLLRIYDALDLDGSGVPRLWDMFETGGTVAADSNVIGATGTSAWRLVSARNGRIYLGHPFIGLLTLNFPRDTAFIARSGGTLLGNYRAGLAVNGAGYDGRVTAVLSNNILSGDAVALPGAPLDAQGLAIPTLLMATDLGLHVLHPDGRSSYVTLAGGYSRARFTGDNRIVAIGAAAPAIADMGPIPYAATTVNNTWRTHRIGASIVIGAASGVILPTQLTVNSGSHIIDVLPDAAPQAFAVNLIAEDVGNPVNSMVAAVGATFNSGWMPSTGIQLATCCEGAPGSVTASGNLLTNGDFATGDLTGWASADLGTGAAASVSDNVLILPRIDANNLARVTKTFATIIGETYRVSFDQLVAVGVNISVGTTLLGFQNGTFFGPIGATVGRGVVQFTATATTTYLLFAGQTNGATAQIDNITATLAAADRSYRQNGLDVVGTLSRAAVGTGNDLAAWSGFSTSNYLTQPYNAGMDFTGDFSVALWIDATATASGRTLGLERVAYSGGTPTGPGFILYGSSGGEMTFRTTLNGFTNVQGVTTAASGVPFSAISHLVAVRRGTVLEIWVNGVLTASATVTVSDLTSAGAIFSFGSYSANTGGPSNTVRYSLLRIAAYAPTPAQIERMFRDERPLLQPGAKAFLGGASTATVRRVSRSRFSNRLAVSMSDGLVMMDGLQRVERHTTATFSPAMASNSITPVSIESGLLLIGTAANAGVRRDVVTGMDRLPANQPTPIAPRVFRTRGVTADATPLIIAPRISIGERELVVVTALITARVYGASDTESITYQRRATYFRNAGGNVTLRGSVQVIGTDVETTSTADATLVVDTAAQTIAAQVTGIAATRLVWNVRYDVERNSIDTFNEETV